jgi:large conductance mechanosensitive channel
MAHLEISGVTGKAGGAAKGFISDFKAFLFKQNVLSLAIAVVVGGAVGKVVSGIVDDVIMPIVGVLLPAGDWRKAELVISGTNAVKYGDLLGRLLDFAIVSAVVFLVVKVLLDRQAAPAAPAPATRACPQCLETIPAAARRCRACGSEV